MQLRPHQLSAYEAMERHAKGQIIVPTGGGKTLIAIKDAVRRLDGGAETIVVVAPRILLAEQLSSEFLEVIGETEHKYISVLHVHSGETRHCSTTKADYIEHWVNQWKDSKIIFTTYHSLHRIVEAGVEVDTIYFDEAHNSVQRNFIEFVEHYSLNAERSYFFTATPKHSATPMKVGMNESDIFGNVICNVPAPKLVKEGYILPPKVQVYKTDILQKDEITFDVECNQIMDNIDDHNTKKILVCAKSTKQITGLVSYDKFLDELGWRGYDCMWITSKTGAIINGKKVSRDKFFETLSAWGKDEDKKFVVLHHSILAEGINVKGLEAVLFLRSMDYIGISTARRVQAVVDTVFQKGEPAISVVTR